MRAAYKIWFALLPFALPYGQALAAKSWTLATLHSFCSEADCADGSGPVAGLVRDSQGNLYGTTETGGAHNNGVVYALKRKAGGFKFQVLHSFCFSCGEGVFPASSLIVDASGNLYGTTLAGGTHDCGTVFRLSPPKWKLRTLHSFTGGGDGDSPDAALTYPGKSAGAPYDSASPLYGTTSRGGGHNFGTAFMLTPGNGKWTATVLHAFCSQTQCADGAEPSGELLVDASGNLFGNAFFGGAHGGGVVFKLSSAPKHAPASESVLYSFCSVADCADGQGPRGALAMDASGALFGATDGTGSENGTVFQLTPDGASGWQENVVHTFCTPPDCADGYAPDPGLVMDSSGNLYGVTELGGTGEGGIGGGTVFRIKAGNHAALYQFCSVQNCADGRVPLGSLILDPHGALYGTTSQGGENSAAGTVFQLSR